MELLRRDRTRLLTELLTARLRTFITGVKLSPDSHCTAILNPPTPRPPHESCESVSECPLDLKFPGFKPLLIDVNATVYAGHPD